MCTKNCCSSIDVKVYFLNLQKNDDKTLWISFVVSFLSQMMLRNCRYSKYVAQHIDMDKKCCCAIFQHWVDFTWYLLHNMSFCRNVCLQVGGNCARPPTNNTSFVSNGDVSTINIVCFKHCSTTQSTLLVIMDISSIMMTFAIIFIFMTLLGLRTIDKYLHTGMWNVMCTIITMEHKQSAYVLVVVDNNTFLPSVWKCCVMYFTKKKIPLPNVLVKTCRPCGFSIMEWNGM
jgi:hypothetical protein